MRYVLVPFVEAAQDGHLSCRLVEGTKLLAVEGSSLRELVVEIDAARTRNPVVGVLHMSHAMAPDPKSPTGWHYSALLLVRVSTSEPT